MEQPLSYLKNGTNPGGEIYFVLTPLSASLSGVLSGQLCSELRLSKSYKVLAVSLPRLKEVAVIKENVHYKKRKKISIVLQFLPRYEIVS